MYIYIYIDLFIHLFIFMGFRRSPTLLLFVIVFMYLCVWGAGVWVDVLCIWELDFCMFVFANVCQCVCEFIVVFGVCALGGCVFG